MTLLAYPLIAHGMIINGIPDVAVILLVSFGLFSITISLIRGAKQKPDQVKIIIYIVIICWGVLNFLSDDTHVLYVPSVTINFLISVFIAASLRDGTMSLMERVIRMSAVEELPALVVREARVLTMIWVAFFFIMAVISLVLAVWADLATWSLFANVLYFIFLGLVILLMHSYQHFRYRRLGVSISWKSAYKLLRMYSSSKSIGNQLNEEP